MDAVNIQISAPSGIADFARLVNNHIPADMRTLSAAQFLRWLRYRGFMKEVLKEDGHKTNLPTEKGNRFGIITEVQRNSGAAGTGSLVLL